MPELAKLALKYGADKETIHGYTEAYEKALLYMQNSATAVLEIGVRDGPSLRMWRDFFPRATIFGVDIDPKYMISGEDRIVTYLADAKRADRMAEVLDRIAPCDLIVDDCDPHTPEDQIAFLKQCWPYVRPGGVYILEDIDPQRGGSLEVITPHIPPGAIHSQVPGRTKRFSSLVLTKKVDPDA
jgi:SAM-dependent methyltransferase